MIDKSSLNLLNALKVSVFSHYSDSSFEIATLTWFWFVCSLTGGSTLATLPINIFVDFDGSVRLWVLGPKGQN